MAPAGLAVLLLVSLLLTPIATAQSAHLALGHAAGQPVTAEHEPRSTHDEHSHQRHRLLHTAGAPVHQQQPKLFTAPATFTAPTPGVVARPAPVPVPERDPGGPDQAHLQVWRT
ncbi:hypothetical protein KZZ52_35685 [Dactylosporangium sp. AC04546]|uniref:hypothetical protein n=1 Tax=Dactylosporangium sp. AC04546 TaxID=2862460 RepID=UPI001EE0F1A0|nr:hypothetical protein [Dactylosporangium sp. AC04546]WVK79313.1 hypothetical protein KZZ52_35685 [Dactylosporangium sp. AC04546]